jgi:hypothetical protein
MKGTKKAASAEQQGQKTARKRERSRKRKATIGCASNETLQTANPIVNRLGNILGKEGECRCCLNCVLTAGAINLFGRLGFIYDKNAT